MAALVMLAGLGGAVVTYRRTNSWQLAVAAAVVIVLLAVVLSAVLLRPAGLVVLVLLAAVYTYRQTNSWRVAAVAGGGTYVLSLGVSTFLHPYVRCGACKGAGRHRGAIFNHAWRPCHVCNGAGRKQRPPAVLLGRGQRTTSGSRIVPPTKSFGSGR